MNILFYSFIFIVGLAFGSFLNVVICRLEAKESIVFGRSHCPFCHHPLAWFDLIPLFSFFLLKKKCRYCHSPISWHYPLVECATGILWVVSTYTLVHRFAAVTPVAVLLCAYNLIIVSALLAIFVFDLRWKIIPNTIIIPLIALAFICEPLWGLMGVKHQGFNPNAAFFEWQWFVKTMFNLQSSVVFTNLPVIPPWMMPLLLGLLSALFFLSIIVASRGKGMGMGDVKLVFLMGLVLGLPGIFTALYIAFLTGALISLELILTKRKKLKDAVPFGPFLVLGTYAVLFFGESLIHVLTQRL